MSEPAAKRRSKICLNMIVKNETKVLDRLFRSIVDFIDYYVIVDTGSTDGTQQFIRQWMDKHDISGEIHERPWVNFGVNRQQALELAVTAGRGDWLLFIDADEELGCSDPKFYEKLQAGVTYDIEKHHTGMRYAVPHLVDVSQTKWQWRGPVHNYLERQSGPTQKELRKDIWIIYHSGEGAKSQGVTSEQKYLRDAKLLEEDLKLHPNSPRSRFYLGQSYKHAGKLDRAYRAYRARTEIKGWVQEDYMAQLEMGRVARLLKKPEEAILQQLLKAFELRPSRAEPLFELASYFRGQKKYGQAYLFAKQGTQMKRPDDTLFVAQDIYDWRLWDELGVAAYWLGKYDEALAAGKQVLQAADGGVEIASSHLDRVRANMRYSEVKLSQ